MGRYEDNDDGTVTDCRTGLIWLKNANCTESIHLLLQNVHIDKSNGTLNWSDAVTWTSYLMNGVCGLTDSSQWGDWRLPTSTEWMAMVASARKQHFSDPALTDKSGTAKWNPGDLFDNVSSDDYWASSTWSVSTNYAGSIVMYGGFVDYTYKASLNYVWPVRAGR